MRLAEVDGERRLPEPHLFGVCSECGETVISKCGNINQWYWSHLKGTDCDSWSEGTGPWHLSWQNMVRMECIEVGMKPHRADIRTFEGLVIELQHSSISDRDIAAREAFYRNMIWLFDATFRFAPLISGDRVFFSLGRTKHLNLCTKPVFLDFGGMVVEVEAFTDRLPGISGFGRRRDRRWFMSRFLQESLVDSPVVSMVKSNDPRQADPWENTKPYHWMKHRTNWINPADGSTLTLPNGVEFIPLTKQFSVRGGPWEWQYETIINQYPEIAAGWTKGEVEWMQEFLSADPVILAGRMRMVPFSAEMIKADRSRSSLQFFLEKLEGHIKAGRVAVVKDETKTGLVRRSEEFERKEYGSTQQPVQSRPVVKEARQLFD